MKMSFVNTKFHHCNLSLTTLWWNSHQAKRIDNGSQSSKETIQEISISDRFSNTTTNCDKTFGRVVIQTDPKRAKSIIHNNQEVS